jgi:OmpA-OmpF porin, OOP family
MPGSWFTFRKGNMQMTFKTWTKPAACAALLMAIGATSAMAADAKGCADPVGLKRFEGSSIVLCENKKFDDYMLPTGKMTDTSTQTFETKLELGGQVTKSVYYVPKGATSAEVFRNYQQNLLDKGFQPIMQGKGEELGRNFDSLNMKTLPETGRMFGYDVGHTADLRIMTAEKDEAGQKTYVYLHVGTGFFKAGPADIDIDPEQVVVRLDTIVVGELKHKMVTVKASAMESEIDEKGSISLYGILFDFNKSEIKPDSRPTLDEIAKLLRGNPERKLNVVGHTDGVGTGDFNLKLSQERAAAVVADLTKTYAIDASRLTSEGAGMTKPVASNDDEAGRTKNRRVELVAKK